MPLRDHFHSPLDDQHSWDALHGGWPMMIVLALRKKLPKRFVASPQVHLATGIEVDVASFERDELHPFASGTEEGGLATAVWAPPVPSLEVVTELSNQDVYEVQVFDLKRNRRLVAAVEIVSPSNKDRPENRGVFVSKCASLMRQGVSVAIVDLVTSRHANLYSELLEFIGQRDPALGTDPPPIYAAECRWTRKNGSGHLQTWFNPLVLGSPLPRLPLWLTPDFAVPLELEQTYEDTCEALRIE